MPAAHSPRRATLLVAIALVVVLLIPAAGAALARQAPPDATPDATSAVTLATYPPDATPNPADPSIALTSDGTPAVHAGTPAGTPVGSSGTTGFTTSTSSESYLIGTPNALGTPGTIIPPTASFGYGRFPSYIVVAGPSDTGHEIRLYRIELAAGQTQLLNGSTNWGITAEAGTVELVDDDAPSQVPNTRITAEEPDGPVTVSGGTIGAAPERTMIHIDGAPAVIWVMMLVPSEAPVLDVTNGANLTLAATLPLAGLEAETVVRMSLGQETASPIGNDLGESRIGTAPSEQPAQDSAPAGIVVAQDDGITITSPDGTTSVLSAGEQQSTPDASGWIVTGALEDYRDEPLRYIAVRARAVDLIPREQQQQQLPATPAPIAIPADAVTITGDGTTCDVEPRTIEELEELPNLFLATPGLYDRIDADWQGAFALAGTGEPLDDTTRDEILRTLDLIAACGNDGDILQSFSLFSDSFLALFVLSFPPELLGELAGTPVAAGTPGSGFSISTPAPDADVTSQAWGFERLPDGRVGLFLATENGIQYLLFVQGPDGTWLLDGQSQWADAAPPTGWLFG